ncbi:MAG: addiction module toxin RelE [Prevotella sp.]|nr:addiction module toxin RelE [Prevotella sp.]
MAKRYRVIADDYEAFLESIKENPLQGTEIAPNIHKIRMAITAKGRGKSGGARVITYNAIVAENEGRIYLLVIYDKADSSNVRMNVVRQIVKDLGL